MRDFCHRLAESEGFERFIITLIVLNALCLGAETDPILTEHYDDLIWAVLAGSQLVFVIEIAIRLVACAPNFGKFFRSFWNTFDFIVVAGSLLPVVGAFATVARVLRVLRVLRIVSVSDELRVFLSRMQTSLGTLIFAGFIWAIFAYVYAIAGFYLFADADAPRWGSLSQCFETVFLLTLLQDAGAALKALPAGSGVYFVMFYAGLVFLGLNTAAQLVNFGRNSGQEMRSRAGEGA